MSEDSMNQNVIPFGQVPPGAFFAPAALPHRRLQKVPIATVYAALTENTELLQIKPDVPCIVEGD